MWKNKGKHFIFLTKTLEHFGSVDEKDIRNRIEMYIPEREKCLGMILTYLAFRVRVPSMIYCLGAILSLKKKFQDVAINYLAMGNSKVQ